MSNIDPTAYDALGRIMSNGGEQSLALSMARGYAGDRVSAMMGRRFGEDFATAGDSLAEFATAMVGAAQMVNERGQRGEEIAPGEVPLNGFLDDEEMGGSRYKWSADVTFEGASSAVTVYGYSTTDDIEQWIQAALEGGIGIIDNYRAKFGLDDGEEINPLTVEFLTVQRAY